MTDMRKLQPYDSYQPVDFDYVSRLPSGWKLLPNIAIFQERIDRGFTDEELLSVTIGRGIIRQVDVDIKKDSSNEDKSKYKLVKVGDIAYNRMRMWQGALGYSEYRGITSPAYVILKPKMKINPRFFHYMFRTGFYTNYSKRFSYGIVDDQLSLRYVDFKRMYTIIPPPETQNTIVTYLDKKTEVLQEFITKKIHLIETLVEREKRSIETLVTKGIEKAPALKPSNIIGLGNVPVRWPVKRLGVIGHFTKGGGISRDELVDEGIAAILYGDIYTKYNYSVKEVVNRIEERTAKKATELQFGDLLFTGSGETKEDIGKCIAFLSNEKAFAGGDVIIFKQRGNNSLYLSYLLNSSAAIFNKASNAKGDIIVHTYASNLKNIFVPLPPIDEQDIIVEEINKIRAKSNNAVSKAKKEIEKAEEYQLSIITQLVTGQLKAPLLAKQKEMS